MAILCVQLLIPQLYNYRIIKRLSEVTLIDFCIASIIAVRLYYKNVNESTTVQQCVHFARRSLALNYWASEASPTLGCSIEISRDSYKTYYAVLS